MFKLGLLACLLFSAPLSFSQSLKLASASTGARFNDGGFAHEISLSPDGTSVAFVSSANDLVPNDLNGSVLDLFVRQLPDGPIRLLSRGPLGSANGGCLDLAWSPDAAYLYFISDASNLVPSDDNAAMDIFRVEVTTGTIERIFTLPPNSTEIPFFELSPTGEYLAFTSAHPTLVERDTNNQRDLFLVHISSREILLASKSFHGASATAGELIGVHDFEFSPRGEYLAFSHAGLDLVAPNSILLTQTPHQSYLFDLSVLTNRPVTARTARFNTSGEPRIESFSPDESLAFVVHGALGSAALLTIRDLRLPSTNNVTVLPDLVTFRNGIFQQGAFLDDNRLILNFSGSLFLYQIGGDSTYQPITTNSAGEFATGSLLLGLTGENRLLAFQSTATNLHNLENPLGIARLYTFDPRDGQIRWLSSLTETGEVPHPNVSISFAAEADLIAYPIGLESLGQLDLLVADLNQPQPPLVVSQPRLPHSSAGGTSTALPQALSADGQQVAFYRTAASPSGALRRDLHLYSIDRATGSLAILSTNDTPTADGINEARVSANGRFIVFATSTSDLGASDTNSRRDIYQKNLESGEVIRLSQPLATIGSELESDHPQISADGSVAVFRSSSRRLDPTQRTGVFVHYFPQRTVRHVANEPVGILTPSGQHFVSRLTEVYSLADPAAIRSVGKLLNGGFLLPNPSAVSSNRVLFTSGAGLHLGEISPISARFLTNQVEQAIISQNGLRIALERSRPGGSSLEIFDDATGQFEVVFPELPHPGINQMAFNADGTRLVFSTRSPLSANDSNDATDIYLYDTRSRTTLLLSANPSGQAASGYSVGPSISADGNTLVFTSTAHDLAPGDLNQLHDVFVFRFLSADSDRDSLPDDWEVTWFGNLDQSPGNDPDGDSMTNLAEFEAGTNPSNGASALVITKIQNVKTGTIRLLWLSAAGKTYQVQFKDRLHDAWQNLGTPTSATQSATEFIDDPGQNPARFYRILVQR